MQFLVKANIFPFLRDYSLRIEANINPLIKEMWNYHCNNCENNQRKKEGLLQREQKYNISREILKKEIRTTSFLQLGKKYNVSNTSIKKWCKSYNLPYKASEIRKYTDEEWKKI